MNCTHPSHVEGKTCEDHAVGCHADCNCCLGHLNAPAKTPFEEAFDKFLTKLWENFSAHNTPEFKHYSEPTAEHGTKYIRIVRNPNRSAYCFVDKVTGDIFKPAGWKAPAKGARGNIFEPATYEKADPYGSIWYR